MKYLLIIFFSVQSLAIFSFSPSFGHKGLQKTLSKVLGEPSSYDLLPIEKGGDDGVYFKVFQEGEIAYLYIGRMQTKLSGYCDFLILYDELGGVEAVSVYDYRAPYGHEIASKSWLKQFVGYNGCDDLKVDVISGATFSVRAIKEEVVVRTIGLKPYLKNP